MFRIMEVGLVRDTFETQRKAIVALNTVPTQTTDKLQESPIVSQVQKRAMNDWLTTRQLSHITRLSSPTLLL